MWIDSFYKLQMHCLVTHDDSFLQGYFWEKTEDDSVFVGAEVSYDGDRIYCFNVYTETNVYIAKEFQSSEGIDVIWSSAPRNPTTMASVSYQ